MKLDQSHVGKKMRIVNSGSPGAVVLYIGKSHVFARGENGSEFASPNTDTDWELVSEPKKPSERIGELMGDTYATPTQWNTSKLDSTEIAVQAIVKFLDEQAEKSNV